MINLLPLGQKEELRQEENWKLVVILGFIFLLFLISLSLILFSINIFISGEVNVQKTLFQQREKEIQDPQAQALQENLITLNQTLSLLSSFYQSRFNSTEILKKISETLPSEAYLANLSLSPQFNEEKEERMNCSLSGFSPTRETLLKLKTNLENENLFEEVYFPPANWVKRTNINFIVSFKIKK